MLSPTEEAINRGEPIRLHRSEFLEKPAEYLIQADDRESIIELCRYHKVTHALIPLNMRQESTDTSPGDAQRSFYRYDKNKDEISMLAEKESHRDPDPRSAEAGTVIGQIITVRPYYLTQYMKDMGYGLVPVAEKLSFAKAPDERTV